MVLKALRGEPNKLLWVSVCFKKNEDFPVPGLRSKTQTFHILKDLHCEPLMVLQFKDPFEPFKNLASFDQLIYLQILRTMHAHHYTIYIKIISTLENSHIQISATKWIFITTVSTLLYHCQVIKFTDSDRLTSSVALN